jgi:5-methylcytosine-specific restriction endonuclease McrA
MESTHVEQAAELLEKANADLEPALLSPAQARRQLEVYVRVQRLASFGVAALARSLEEATELARVTGTSVAKGKETLATAQAADDSPPLKEALKHGEISLDQAAEIAKAEDAAPGVASELLAVAQKESFAVLREQARKATLEAEQHRGLAKRQHAARSARSYLDDLGMVHVHLAWEPHVGSPIVKRAEAEASRLYRSAKRDGRREPFERHLADAYAALLAGEGKGRARRPELVVLVSHEVATRGWKDVREGELCKIPGVGPVAPEVARKIAADAFLTGLFYDGKDLRHIRRWTRSPQIEVLLELGEPPGFDGVRCVGSGNRFHPENDHVEPHVAGGPASLTNLEWRCWPCHQKKTERDRRAGKLRAPDP